MGIGRKSKPKKQRNSKAAERIDGFLPLLYYSRSRVI